MNSSEEQPSLGGPQANAIRAVAIASGKGGTGKSILTSSLGCLLAKCGFRVLLVDMDIFTSGLSFYIMAKSPRRTPIGLQDVFIKGRPWEELQPINIPSPYTSDRLYLIPAISRSKVDSSELRMIPSFDLRTLYRTLGALKEWALTEKKFDFVLFDTRGGTDLTSIATCVAAGAFIAVTEADKTSWEVGGVLIESVYDVATELSEDCLALGYILNKNVLPSEAIEIFLQRNWGLPHLATIPLDDQAIRAFQNDEIPVVSAPHSRFSVRLVPVVRKVFYSDLWSPEQKQQLVNLETDARPIEAATAATDDQLSLHERRFLWLKTLTVFLAVAVLIAAILIQVFRPEISRTILTVFSIFAALLAIVASLSDQTFATSLAKLIVGSAPVSEPLSRYKYDVYVSYSGRDSEFAEWLISRFRSWNLSVFYDKNLLPGQNINLELTKAMANSRYVVTVLSESYLTTASTMRELEQAMTNNARIIPIVVDNSPPTSQLPRYLADLIVVWMTTAKEREAGLEKIRKVLLSDRESDASHR